MLASCMSRIQGIQSFRHSLIDSLFDASFTHTRSLAGLPYLFSYSFDFTPEQVLSFCEECVLSEDEEPCDVPDAFYDLDQLKP